MADIFMAEKNRGDPNYLRFVLGWILQVSIFLARKPLGGSSHLGYVVSEGGKPSPGMILQVPFPFSPNRWWFHHFTYQVGSPHRTLAKSHPGTLGTTGDKQLFFFLTVLTERGFPELFEV